MQKPKKESYTAGVSKLSKNVSVISKFWAPEGWYETRSLLRTNKFRCQRTEFSCRRHLDRGIGIPLLYSLHKITLTSGPLATISATRGPEHDTYDKTNKEIHWNLQLIIKTAREYNSHGTNGCSCFWNVHTKKLQSTFISFAMYVSKSQCENCMKFGIGNPKMCRISVKLENNNVYCSTNMTCFSANLSTARWQFMGGGAVPHLQFMPHPHTFRDALMVRSRDNVVYST
jgi:hypothetical protein